ncbi:unnamed protein product [Spirodela intermedia]|uniref:Uncharacterized protein n=1 Tax=Spirodela intermedia TaxID=51605 RepID=A0A7I8IZ86_SPIIN|nr:unnamed protein product [Spirodela intermedia]CAA6662461.1 unnamed protein product [Spirodela intermedia]
MASAWRKAKIALGLNLCVHVPRTLDDASPSDDTTGRFSDAATSSPASTGSATRRSRPMTRPLPHPSSGSPNPAADPRRFGPFCSTISDFLLPDSSTFDLFFSRTCAICLGMMKPGHGHALFTAECSHAFHFHCIASSVKHGNQVCPLPHGRARVNPLDWPQEDGRMTIWRPLPRSASSGRHHHYQHHPLLPFSPNAEPRLFDDDEPLDPPRPLEPCPGNKEQGRRSRSVELKICPEFSAVQRSASPENFTVLVHLKAPVAGRVDSPASSSVLQTSRAPVDLVTVLDVSGSMAGTKLALLKRAMGFVIQNLGPSDRLSVVAFSSTARRLFQLRRMTEIGGQQALQAVNSLVASGGTNIAEGLRKAVKVIEERKEKNPVCSIILLSDGQDTYTLSSSATAHRLPPLLPYSIRSGGGGGGMGQKIPVHAFGFGTDHDSTLMHSISDISGGTFSFIEAESVIQDAFAQCIGGLLSVVVQEMRVEMECLHPGVKITAVKSGSYAGRVADDRRRGSIAVGDLYADEERDFLVSLSVPPAELPAAETTTALLKVACSYRDPASQDATAPAITREVSIQRTDEDGSGDGDGDGSAGERRTISMEVDRQRNRHLAAEAMAEAKSAAEGGELAEAVAILERAGDRLCMALEAELKETQERMASRQRYEASGRAYVLSGLSSHSWQRATARGTPPTAPASSAPTRRPPWSTCSSAPRP